MKTDINTLRNNDRDGEDVLAPDHGGEGTKSSGQEEMFRKSLSSAVQTCQLSKDYNEALPQWHIATNTLQELGCPFALVQEYEQKLKDYFVQRREMEAKRYMDLIVDNHGGIFH